MESFVDVKANTAKKSVLKAFGLETKATYDANGVARRAVYFDKLTLYAGKKGTKEYVFQRGIVDLPDELSLHNFVETW